MVTYLSNKETFREAPLEERGQLARRSLRRRLGLAHSDKINSSFAALSDLCAIAVQTSSLSQFRLSEIQFGNGVRK